MAVDTERLQAAIVEILAGIGEQPDRPGLAETPQRAAAAFAELFAGIGSDPVQELGEPLPAGESTGELVIVRELEFRSMCEHHLLPFAGVAHIAYVPGERIVGIGRLVRVLEALSARPQLQERLTEQIADTLVEALDPAGVLVVIDARHDCMAVRGPRAARSTTLTIASRGELAVPDRRAEAVSLIQAADA